MSTKRYTIQCPACGLCAPVTRWGARTCSGACRVRLHRHRELWMPVEVAARSLNVDPFLVLLCGAVKLLRPDLLPAIKDGTRDIVDAQDEVHAELERRVFGAVR